ncbi:MAG: AmmeMemoRadiSam system radical SAM enzyme [bacterium]|nr:AmmeMemoRadiSam system radical SAM enzyme [bacterium]
MPATVQCLLCKKECKLVEGQRGDCRVRVNLEGKLMTLVYGKPCAVHIDPIEKKPLYHVLPTTGAFSISTAGCNLHCKFCQNWQISQREPEDTRNIDLSPEQVVESAIKANCRSIAYTYAEPIIFYEYMLDTCKLAHNRRLKNLWITAGFINREPLKELCLYMDAANIDLKSIREDYYKDICSGEVGPVLETIKTAKAAGVWVEITNLVVPTLNDSRQEIEDLVDFVLYQLGPDIPLHFSRFHPMYQLKNLPPTPVSTLDMARNLAIDKGLYYVYAGNVPGHPGNNTYCPNCKGLIIGRTGYLILKNRVQDGRCEICGFKIAGIWD